MDRRWIFRMAFLSTFLVLGLSGLNTLASAETKIEACAAVFEENHNIQSCLSSRTKFADVVHLCDESFDENSNKLDCMQGLSVAIVNACLNGFSEVHNELSCIADAKSASQVSSCIAIFKEIHQQLECLRSI